MIINQQPRLKSSLVSTITPKEQVIRPQLINVLPLDVPIDDHLSSSESIADLYDTNCSASKFSSTHELQTPAQYEMNQSPLCNYSRSHVAALDTNRQQMTAQTIDHHHVDLFHKSTLESDLGQTFNYSPSRHSGGQTATNFGRESGDFQYSESLVQSRLMIRDLGDSRTPSSIEFKLTTKGDERSTPKSINQQSSSCHKNSSRQNSVAEQRLLSSKPVSDFFETTGGSVPNSATSLQIKRQENVMWAVKPLKFEIEPQFLRQSQQKQASQNTDLEVKSINTNSPEYHQFIDEDLAQSELTRNRSAKKKNASQDQRTISLRRTFNGSPLMSIYEDK